MQRHNHTRRGITAALAIALTTAVGIGASIPAQAADVTRLAGDDRIATGLNVFESNRNVFTGTTAVVAGIGGFADALSASPLAAAYRGPVLSTKAGDLDSRVIASLRAQGIKNVVVMGGTGAVSDAALQELKAAGLSVERLGGGDRYETAALAAQRAMKVRGVSSVPVFIADGSGYADALSAGSAAVKAGGVVILSRNGALDREAKQFLADRASSVVAIGGLASKAIKAAGVPGESIAGSDRYDTAAKVAARFFPDAGMVVLASGEGYGDAVSGSPLAALTGAPLLLTKGASLPTPAAKFLAATNADITILGGTGAISTVVATKAEAVADSGDVAATTPNQPAPTQTPTPKPTITPTPSPTTTAPTPGVIGPNPSTPTGNAAGSGVADLGASAGTKLPTFLLGSSSTITGPVTAEPVAASAPSLKVGTFTSGLSVFATPELDSAAPTGGTYSYNLMVGKTKVGTYTLKVESAPTTPSITGGGTFAPGGRMTLTTTATNNNLTYEWLKSTTESGTPSLVATTTEPTYSKVYSDSDKGFYKVRVRNTKGEAISTQYVGVYTSNNAVKASKLVITAPSPTKVGTSQTITGKLTESDGSTAIQSATVKVTLNGKTVTATTSTNGVFTAADVPVTVAGNQTATVAFEGDEAHSGTSATSASFAVAKATPSVTLGSISGPVIANTDVAVTGTVSDLGIAGTVEFYDVTASGATEAAGGTKIGTGTVKEDGTFTGSIRFTETGTSRKVVARFGATANSEGAYTTAQTVTVNATA